MKKLILLFASVALTLIGCFWPPIVPIGYINLSNPTDEPVTVYSEYLNNSVAFQIDARSSCSVIVNQSSENSVRVMLYGPYYGGRAVILSNVASGYMKSYELPTLYSRFRIDNETVSVFDNLYIADSYGNKAYMLYFRDNNYYAKSSDNRDYEVSSYNAKLRQGESGYIFVESSILRNPCKLYGIIGNMVLETDRYSLFQAGNTVTMSASALH